MFAQKSGGSSIPENVEGQTGWDSDQTGLVKVSLLKAVVVGTT